MATKKAPKRPTKGKGSDKARDRIWGEDIPKGGIKIIPPKRK